MRFIIPTLCAIAVSLVVTTQVVASSAVVLGPSTGDPIERQGLMNSGGKFYLTNNSQASLVRFDRPWANAVCNRISRGVNAAPPVPLDVEWNGRSAVVMPGECIRIDAPGALVAPAAPMDKDTILQGM